jgi:Ni2+-binding GTPase involved in maturation of urease and hydrogenase
MIGGFLGAGKTTAVAQLAQRLAARGRRVGLITNDQGSELVDTAMLRARGFATEEISGGCFCCRFNSLVDAARKLTAASRPDVFIAEPVGSCTDLVATVTYPLRRLYGDDFCIAPLSVLLDPVRALRILGLEEGGRFSEKVRYIYRKQLEEADLLVINKADLIDAARQERLRTALEREFPGKGLSLVSARTGAGLEAWFDTILDRTQPGGEAIGVDYAVYAEGEALLGWLNATVQLTSADGFDGNAILREVAVHVQTRLDREGVEVAHLKMTLSPDAGLGEIAVVNLVRNDFVPELALVLPDQVDSGQLIINLRAEGSPETLKAALEEALSAERATHPNLAIRRDHLEYFRPGEPRPTHRVASLVAESSATA